MNTKHGAGEPTWHTFEGLSDVSDLAHGVFTRHGGVSKPPYDSLNVARNNGDSQEAVRENLSRVKAALGLDRLVSCRQVHGDTVRIIDEEAIEQSGDYSPVIAAPPGDALVTNLRGVGLLIKIADCQAVFLVDPVHGVIANIHCGWRGTVKGLAAKVVRTLVERFNSRPADLIATISPSLGPCCAEFRSYRDELPPAFWPFQAKPSYFDFWAISESQLLGAGLLAQNIEIAHRCTVCESRDFFSYRGEGTTGRLAAVIAWRQSPGQVQGK